MDGQKRRHNYGKGEPGPLGRHEANPITLALEASNGTDLMKDRWFEETFGGAGKKCWPEAGA